MVKCPFCGFDNEDGALFCEQCKSDLSSVPAPVVAEAVPVAAVEAFPVAEAVPVEAIPVEAVAVEAVAVEAVPVEAVPVEAVAVEAVPVVAIPEPVHAPAAPPVPVAAAAPVPAPPPAPPAPVAAAPAPVPPPAAPAPAAPAAGGAFPPGSQLKLIVQRGLKTGVEYPIYPDYNYIGRSDDKPVDIDLDDQEPPDRVWCSRQHAVLHFDEQAGVLTIEDLNSSNGTYVNRAKVYPGQKIALKANDVIQIGTVHLKLKA